MTSPGRGWTRVKLGDVADEYARRIDNPSESGLERFVGSNHIGRFELSVSNWGSTSDVTSAMKLFQPGDYLFVRRSLYASDFRERAARATFEGVCSGDILTIREKQGAVAEGFLSAVLNDPRIWAYVVAHATGSITRRIKWRQLAEYEFALPPLEEQRRIARSLVAMQGANEAYAELIVRCEALQLASSFSAFADFLDDESVPERCLGELLTEDISNGIFRKREQFGTGMRLVNVTDCYAGFEVQVGLLERVPVDPNEYDSFCAKSGDVIFNRSSIVLEGVGHACLVPMTEEKLVFECHLMRVRPDISVLDPRYLTYYALSPHGRRYLMSRAQTTTMTTIGQSDLRQMPIPVPATSRQRELTGRLDTIAAATRMLVERRMKLREFQKRTVAYALRPRIEVSE